jgi:hypothetical protein
MKFWNTDTLKISERYLQTCKKNHKGTYCGYLKKFNTLSVQPVLVIFISKLLKDFNIAGTRSEMTFLVSMRHAWKSVAPICTSLKFL